MRHLFVTQAQGIEAEEPFIRSHAAYASRHGMEHRIVTDVDFPEFMRRIYENPFKFAKPLIMIDALKSADYVMFAESDVMLTDIDRLPPVPKEGHWLRAGSCRVLDGEQCICPCLMCAVARAEGVDFFGKAIEMMGKGFPDGGPFDEVLFHEVQKAHGPTGWDKDFALCSYHNAAYRDHSTKPWQRGDFAIHISGVPWTHKSEVLASSVSQHALKPGISLLVTVHDNVERLMIALPSWQLSDLQEIVIVDWESAVPVSARVPWLLNDPRVTVVRVEGSGPYNTGRALNAGLSFVACDTVLKIEPNHVLVQPGSLVNLRNLRDGGVLRGNAVTGPDDLLLVDTRLAQGAGYREDLQGNGFTDVEFVNRLRLGRLSSNLAVAVLPGNEKTHAIEDMQAATVPPLRPPRIRTQPLWSTPQSLTVSEIPPAPTRTILAPEDLEPVFGAWHGKKVLLGAWIDNNPGNALTHAATVQMLKHFQIAEAGWNDAEVVMWVGSEWTGVPEITKARDRFLTTAKLRGLPTVILPTVWRSEDPTLEADYVFARDTESLRFVPQGMLGADVALAFTGETYPVYRQNERESAFFKGTTTDPIDMLPATDHKAQRYVQLAYGYKHIITDRLHFAVAGLLAGSTVTLVPGATDKNRRAYEQHLEAAGCLWEGSRAKASCLCVDSEEEA